MVFVEKVKKAYFVGIGGVGMSSLASHLSHLGVEVSGSDKSLDGCSTLVRQSVKVFVGHDANNLDEDTQLVVFSQAIEPNNCELIRARSLGIPVVSREQLLGQIFNSYDRRVAVCGTHGKTTVTAMIDFVLRKLGVEHTAFIGGFACDNRCNYTAGNGLVVAESCEYKGSFLSLFPTLAVALNVEYDHPDCFENLAHVESVFEQFFAKLPPRGLLLAHNSVPQKLLLGKNYVTFGDDNCYYHANNVTQIQGGFCFNFCKGAKCFPVVLNLLGEHNVTNAVACLATIDCLGIDVEKACNVLQHFAGVGRRWNKHNIGGAIVVEDYAHHPTEIVASIKTAKQLAKSGRLIVMFQPHTYTRTKALWRQFATCFAGADLLAMLPVFAAREQSIEGVTSQKLLDEVDGVGQKVHLDSLDKGAIWLKSTMSMGDVVLVLGAGDINKICNMI